MRVRPILLAAAFLAGCAPADKVDALEQRVATLEEEVKTLKASPGGAKAGAAAANSPEEAAAEELLKDIAALTRDGKYDEAKTKLATLKGTYGSTTAYKKARKLEQELDIIGKDAPPSWEMEKWFQGQGNIDLTSNKTTLVVFWEVWCPHCQREVPELEATYKSLGPQGLQVVGVTKITKSATEEKVTEFIKEKGVTYPMAKETGALSEYFGVSGIPAAAVVKDGKVVWRGHPARLDDETLKAWL